VPTRSSIDRLEIVGEVVGQFRGWRWRNVAFFSWVNAPSAQGAREHAVLFTALAKSQTTKLSSVNVVAGRFSLPDAQARAVMADLVHTQAERLACVSIIVPGTGFWVSAVRSFATGMLSFGQRAFDLHVNATSNQVVEWFPEAHQRQTGTTVDPTELRDHIDTVVTWHTHPQP
jgi:hypothetical protein